MKQKTEEKCAQCGGPLPSDAHYIGNAGRGRSYFLCEKCFKTHNLPIFPGAPSAVKNEWNRYEEDTGEMSEDEEEAERLGLI
jgi:hypothetical protein